MITHFMNALTIVDLLLKDYSPAIQQQKERIWKMDCTMSYLNEIEDKLCKKHKKLLKYCENYFTYSGLCKQSQQKNGKWRRG